MSSESERTNRRSRRQRNLAQRDSWNRTKGGAMKDRSKYTRKNKTSRVTLESTWAASE